MKYCYKVGYYSHEESAEVSLWHEEQYTAEQLDEIVCKAYVLSYLDETGEAYEMEKHCNSKEYHKIYKDESRATLQWCWDLMITYLVSDFGFKESKYEASSWVNGWAKLGDEDREGTYKESETTKQMLRALVAVERKW